MMQGCELGITKASDDALRAHQSLDGSECSGATVAVDQGQATSRVSPLETKGSITAEQLLSEQTKALVSEITRLEQQHGNAACSRSGAQPVCTSTLTSPLMVEKVSCCMEVGYVTVKARVLRFKA